jgi:hypothetical protein
MPIDDSESINGQLSSMNYVKEPLRPVIDTIDQDILSMTLAQNALTPLCRLPDELLIYILILVQTRYGYNDYDLPDRSLSARWRRVMRVCSRFRVLALHSPELWSFVDCRWPEKWRRLCIERAMDYPLHLISEIREDAQAVATSHLLGQCGIAFIHFKDRETRENFEKMARRILDIQAPMLRAFVVYTHEHNHLTLSPRFLAGQCLALSSLSLTSVHVEDVPPLPTLQRLSLSHFKLSSRTDLLRRLFSSMPRLTVLQMNSPISGTPQPQNTTPCYPLHLIHLEHVEMTYATVALLWSVLQMLVPPTRVLRVHMCSNGPEPETVVFRNKILSYVRQFWHRATGAESLPDALLETAHSKSGPQAGIDIEIHGHGRILKEVRVQMPYYPTNNAEDVALLRSVSRLFIYTQEDAVYLDPESWPLIGNLDALEELTVVTYLPRKIIQAVQAWADRRMQLGLRTARVVIMHAGKITLVWNPEDGPLENAN